MVALLGSEEDTRTKKIVTGVSQALCAEYIAQELDGHVRKLSWYLEDLTVRCGYDVNCPGMLYSPRYQISLNLLVYIAVDVRFGLDCS